MGEPLNVKMGVCNVSFSETDLGYTKGNVTVSYSTETVEKTVDQLDTPIDEMITKQDFTVKVPLAEHDLDRLATLLPGATLVTDSVDPELKRLDLSGASGVSLSSLAGKLVIQPVGAVGETLEDVILYNAIPIPNFEYTYDKEDVRVYEITFRAAPSVDGWVSLGAESATA